MHQVDGFQAKTEPSKLLSALEDGTDDEIIIERNGKPIARLLPWEEKETALRIGAAKGAFKAPPGFDADDGIIEMRLRSVE